MEYSNTDKETMANTYKSLSKSRLDELVKFAKNSKITKIGIANCLSVQKYADALAVFLTEQGFEVISYNCKQSGLRNEEVLGEGFKGPSCDPLSQAEFLNNNGSELNLNVGLCLGHGILLNKYLKAPVTTILVKNFANKHNNLLEDLTI